jgi:hypothetical protein
LIPTFLAIAASSIKKTLGLHHWHQFLREKCDQPVVSSATGKHLIRGIAKTQLLQFGNSPVIDFGTEVVHSQNALYAMSLLMLIPSFSYKHCLRSEAVLARTARIPISDLTLSSFNTEKYAVPVRSDCRILRIQAPSETAFHLRESARCCQQRKRRFEESLHCFSKLSYLRST